MTLMKYLTVFICVCMSKTYTMLGLDDRPDTLGVIPLSIARLFRVLQNDQDDDDEDDDNDVKSDDNDGKSDDDDGKSDGRSEGRRSNFGKFVGKFVVRVSALEIVGKNVKDLLLEWNSPDGPEIIGSTLKSPQQQQQQHLQQQQLQHQQHYQQQHHFDFSSISKHEATTAEQAALCLDSAIASRPVLDDEQERRHSHFLFTLHVCREIDSGQLHHHGCLHLLDLGSCGRHKDCGSTQSLTEVGNVISSILNGKQFIPHGSSQLTNLLKCMYLPSKIDHTSIIVHVSTSTKSYNQTLQVLHFASQLKKSLSRTRYASGMSNSTISSRSNTRHSDVDYSSSSEQSVDTVIFVANGKTVGKDPTVGVNCEKPTLNSTPPIAKIHLKNRKNRIASCEKDDLTSSVSSIRAQPPGRESIFRGELNVENEKSDNLHDEIVSNIFKNKTIENSLLTSGKTEVGGSNKELWVDGPKKNGSMNHSEKWIDGPIGEFWTTPHAGIHGISSPKIKKIYSALKNSKHKQNCCGLNAEKVSTVSDAQENVEVCPNNIAAEPSAEPFLVEASPEINAFHNFYTKYKQDLIQNDATSISRNHIAEIFSSRRSCCCKCHLDRKLNFKSPKRNSSKDKEGKHRLKKLENLTSKNCKSNKTDRTAKWVCNVQDSSFAKFSQLLHSRKELLKTFQSPKNKQNLKPILVEYFQNASPIATFDASTKTKDVRSSSSPPPDYSSCLLNNCDVMNNKTSIDQNYLGIMSDLKRLKPYKNLLSNVDDCFNCSMYNDDDNNNNNCLSLSTTFPDVTLNNVTEFRKSGPDGASCHDLFFEIDSSGLSMTDLNNSIHNSLKRNHTTKASSSHKHHKNGLNYSSTETIYIPNTNRLTTGRNEETSASNWRNYCQLKPNSTSSPSKSNDSPVKRDRCNIAMALLSCATRNKKRSSSNCRSKKPQNSLYSSFCLKPHNRNDNINDGIVDRDVPRYLVHGKRTVTVTHKTSCNGANNIRSVITSSPSNASNSFCNRTSR
ncbi:hypothetical protein HELRODRAFT_194738 [Helobdella robusta]|uniref:Kinesin motor domain-containing protein n=1 Tax=Helobdella robusta TaxID=6412 RepID=T1FWD1_HELRO|nr:hypothetical protein HELRODRAFT_194738 [Helobdella robusta]ESN89885.1 hypothetical protein HELRODRAFT_194738 [Helobdella robusta]